MEDTDYYKPTPEQKIALTKLMTKFSLIIAAAFVLLLLSRLL